MEMVRVDRSSNVAAYGYDAASQTLGVEFKSGGRYKYFGVPKEKVDGFEASKSKGGFLRKEIQGTYEVKRLEDGEDF